MKLNFINFLFLTFILFKIKPDKIGNVLVKLKDNNNTILILCYMNQYVFYVVTCIKKYTYIYLYYKNKEKKALLIILDSIFFVIYIYILFFFFINFIYLLIFLIIYFFHFVLCQIFMEL